VRVNMLSPSDLTHDVSGGVRFSRNFMWKKLTTHDQATYIFDHIGEITIT
jgi:hypothetical protein